MSHQCWPKIVAFYERMTVDLARRAIQLMGFAAAAAALVRFGIGDLGARDAVLLLSVGTYLVAHPFDGHPVAQLVAELLSRRRDGHAP